MNTWVTDMYRWPVGHTGSLSLTFFTEMTG